MLNIFLGDMSEAIYHPTTYFDNQYEVVHDMLSFVRIAGYYV